MKLLAAIAVLSLAAAAQNSANPQLKHVISPQAGNKGFVLTAENIVRDSHYPGLITLKGKVEIRIPVCLPAGKDASMVCEGETVVRADAAEFHEDTGEIAARGNVQVTPGHRKD